MFTCDFREIIFFCIGSFAVHLVTDKTIRLCETIWTLSFRLFLYLHSKLVKGL